MNFEEIRQKYSAENVMKIVREGRILVDKECDDHNPKPFDKSCVLHEIYQRGETRCFVQRKLYDIYFRPDGISYKDSNLHKLTEERDITDEWYLRDHNEAVKLIMLFKGNMKDCKDFVKTMYLHQGYAMRLERYRKYYNQIITYYQVTGFLEELSTDI